MRFGVSTFVTDEGIAPADLGRALEERGFASLFVAEHTHIPVSRETPYPGGGDLPRIYYRTLDPIVALTAAAVVTERLTLGTGIALIPQRDPIVFAKEVASLDFISGGRTALGIGGGWNREEMRDHGTEPKTRMALMRERVLAMKEIWANDEAEFHGEHVDFDPMFSWPKPVRTPPVLVGGWGPKTFDRVLDYGDGWMPIAEDPARIAEGVRELRERAGRRIPVTVYAAPAKKEAVDALIAAEVDEILLYLPTKPADETLSRLDRMAELIA
ncbi:LLM class F420-dependent oxidoreductase [Actinoallomurus soli]|uniref:LLM class F420-dependent oxidoreductase n=1 Tax=Actinoallomurus soli TaxID=2952535 RepID=UPI002092506B|nr:LLM class F420-dependent oxidoreductase [Actinoallomurus soli]MCO5970892.1 LLM class F420-dependent oxidoreductase [Actinoallomurus soli]